MAQNEAELKPLDSVAFGHGYGPAIARALCGNAQIDKVSIGTIKATKRTLTMFAEVAEHKTVIKHFRPGDKTAAMRFKRESMAISHFGDSGLIPKPLKRSNEHQILIFEHLVGNTVAECLAPDTLQVYCERLGKWLGNYTRQTPTTNANEDWFEYLSKYEIFSASEIVAAQKERLSNMPIQKMGLARNDGDLSNFIVRENGTIAGVDFDSAAMKPLGWDMLLTASAIARYYPHKTSEIAGYIAMGFCENADMPLADMVTLAKIFIAANVIEFSSIRTTPQLEKIRRKHNETSPVKAPIVANAPFRSNETEHTKASQIAALQAHVAQVVRDVFRDPKLGEEQIEQTGDTRIKKPNLAMSAVCAACQGHCCMPGLKSHGFIDHSTVARLRRKMPDISEKGAIAFYVDKVREQKIKGSCLFHGTDGCSLPWTTRSHVCRRYSCQPAKRFVMNAGPENGEGALIVAGGSGQYQKAIQIRDGEAVVVDIPEL